MIAFVRVFCTVTSVLLLFSACAPSEPEKIDIASNNAKAEQLDPTQLQHWPAVTWPFEADPALETRVAELMAKMSIEEKVGQLVQGDIASISPDDLRKYRLGSILAGGNSDPSEGYNAPALAWLALSDAFYQASMDTSGGHNAIPVLFGIDAVHGQSNVKGATLFPHNIGLGATRNVELMRRIGEITAIETRVTGMEWAFAPTVAVPQDDRWGRTYEGYSESPELVASFAAAVVEGLQGKANSSEFLDDAHVMVSVKHFVGDGGTHDGKDQGDAALDMQTLAAVHGAGYPPAIAAGAQSVMASFNSVNGEKMHGNRALLSDVLKQRMNFGGFVVGDWNGHGQVKGCSNDACPESINAGLDMLMAPDTWKANYESMLEAAKSGEISPQRLDDAVARVLRVKFRLGLFDDPKPSARQLGGKFALLGAPEHRAVARQAVRESLVLLKNENNILPLHPKQRILVAGHGADNMSQQAGGWTLNWQGSGTKREDFPNAQTIFEGIGQQVSAAGGSATLARDGSYQRKPDLAIVVFGEEPYAEFQGDIPNLAYKNGDSTDLMLIKKLRADGVPVVAVFLSGRPLWMNREINAANAFVAAWLPGSEGGGIADVIFRNAAGEPQYDFRGKLSFSWPNSAVQFQNNVGQENYQPAFEFGYGLSYAATAQFAPLPEESGLSEQVAQVGKFMARGVANPGFVASLKSGSAAAIELGEKSAETADKRLAWITENDQAQQDSRRLRWAGTGQARFVLQAKTVMDLARESNADLIMVLRIRVMRSHGDPLWLSSGCSGTVCAQIDLGQSLRNLPAQTWRRLGVPLKCFAAAGADVSALQELVALETAGAWEIALSHIELAALNEADQLLSCAKPSGMP